MKYNKIKENVYIIKMGKIGCTSIAAWLVANNLDNWSNDEPSGIVYAFWREPYGRMVTALNTVFNRYAWAETHEIDTPELKEIYMRSYHAFVKDLDFYRTKQLIWHAYLIQERVEFPENVKWIHLDQLDLFPAFLLREHGIESTTPMGKLNDGEGADNPNVQCSNFTKTSVLQNLINDTPVDQVIKDRAKLDYRPALLDISK